MRSFKNTQHAYRISSTTELLGTEIKYELEKVFVEKNNYPKWVIRVVSFYTSQTY